MTGGDAFHALAVANQHIARLERGEGLNLRSTTHEYLLARQPPAAWQQRIEQRFAAQRLVLQQRIDRLYAQLAREQAALEEIEAQNHAYAGLWLGAENPAIVDGLCTELHEALAPTPGGVERALARWCAWREKLQASLAGLKA